MDTLTWLLGRRSRAARPTAAQPRHIEPTHIGPTVAGPQALEHGPVMAASWAMEIAEEVLGDPCTREAPTPADALARYVAGKCGAPCDVPDSPALRGEVFPGTVRELTGDTLERMGRLSERCGLSRHEILDWSLRIAAAVLFDQASRAARSPRDALAAYVMATYARSKRTA